jgi:hypothetical protein
MDILLKDIKFAQLNGVESFDPVLKRRCLVIPVLVCVLADNPRAGELAATRGCQAIAPCRFCNVKLSQIKEGVHDSPLRTPEKMQFVRNFALTLPAAQKEKILKFYGLKDEPSAFDNNPIIGFNTFSDFPVEVLHTILLVMFFDTFYPKF